MVTAILLVAIAAEAIGLPGYPTTPAAIPVAVKPAPEKSAPQRETRVTAPREQRANDRGRRRISGKASWHATGRSGLYAAACRPLRQAMGPGWRGDRVLVAVGRRAVEVRLNDWCASRDKTIDLSDEAFRYLAPLSRGVVKVTVEW